MARVDALRDRSRLIGLSAIGQLTYINVAMGKTLTVPTARWVGRAARRATSQLSYFLCDICHTADRWSLLRACKRGGGRLRPFRGGLGEGSALLYNGGFGEDFGFMRLGDVANGRDNNLNLIRLLAASAVLVSHSYPLATGDASIEPLRAKLAMTPGAIAVDIFFIVSGFLVTASLLKSRSLLDFAWARSLRIFPGLWVMLALTVFVLGPMVTSVSLGEYFSSKQLLRYVVYTGTLFAGVAYELPGVFLTIPYERAVNGSLWTMAHEVRMYAILAIAWWFVVMVARRSRLSPERLLKRVVSVAVLISGAACLWVYMHVPAERQGLWLFFAFFSGAAFYFYRHAIELHRGVFWAALLSLIASAIWAPRPIYFAVYTVTLAYLVFYLAYRPSGWIRRYNSVGDYSYGIYVYAFVVQQTVVMLMPGISIWKLTAVSGSITLVLAMLSWHLLEKPALAHKNRAVALTRRLLARRATPAHS